MKRASLICLMIFCVQAFSFGQIYRCEGEAPNGGVPMSLHFVDYADYSYLLYIGGVSFFLNEDNIAQLRAILEKFSGWEEIAINEGVSLTKTIGAVNCGEYHRGHSFNKSPVSIYFVFTGGPALPGAAGGETLEPEYSLFVDPSVDTLVPFNLTRDQAEEFLAALSPEKLAEARDAYERQKALEALFN
jgi:hypothetical protein